MQDQQEPAIAESKELNKASKSPTPILVSDDNDSITLTSRNNRLSLFIQVEQTFDLTNTVKNTYQKDKLYSKILENPEAHALFGCKVGFVFTKNLQKWDILCDPHEAFQKGKWVIKIIRDHAHTIISHFNQFKTAQYIRRYFWWMSMVQDIEAFCTSCSACAVAKDTNSKPKGLLHGLPVPNRRWQPIGIDFMGPLPQLNNSNYLLVMID